MRSKSSNKNDYQNEKEMLDRTQQREEKKNTSWF